MSPNVQPRPPRADAQRNKTHILEVASDAFAEEGINVSMDSIAKRAGVGPGTLYRHFLAAKPCWPRFSKRITPTSSKCAWPSLQKSTTQGVRCSDGLKRWELG